MKSATLSAATFDLGRQAHSALLGLDALYRAESGDDAGLAVVRLTPDPGPTARTAWPAQYASYEDARADFGRLRIQAAGLPEPDRRRYYDQLCHSSQALVTWRTEGLRFEDRIRDFLHVPAAPASARALEELRGRLHVLLGNMGYAGDLRGRCAAWEERNRVPTDEVPGVVAELIREAWNRTEERVTRVPSPRSDGMRVEPVSGVAYNARCDYLARTIQLNTDPVLTLPGLRHLAVHEGLPGHYLQFRLREAMVGAGEATADVLLSVVNTASSSVFEGIADAALSAIGWDEDDDARVQSLMNRYRAGIGTVAAWQRHALGWPELRVENALAAASLTGGDGWIANRMRFIEAPSRAVLIWSYWWGEPSVAPVWSRVPTARRPEFVRYLYGRMHSVDTVGMFG